MLSAKPAASRAVRDARNPRRADLKARRRQRVPLPKPLSSCKALGSAVHRMRVKSSTTPRPAQSPCLSLLRPFTSSSGSGTCNASGQLVAEKDTELVNV